MIGARDYDTALAATIGLTETQAEFYNVARKFAEEEFAPHADLWDEKKIFPEAALRQVRVLIGDIYACSCRAAAAAAAACRSVT
jgi:hypothetical protein